MSDQIILLEERKEVTTFLLDDGDVTSKEVVTINGRDVGYEYSAKIYPEDTVAISPKSEIKKDWYWVSSYRIWFAARPAYCAFGGGFAL